MRDILPPYLLKTYVYLMCLVFDPKIFTSVSGWGSSRRKPMTEALEILNHTWETKFNSQFQASLVLSSFISHSDAINTNFRIFISSTYWFYSFACFVLITVCFYIFKMIYSLYLFGLLPNMSRYSTFDKSFIKLPLDLGDEGSFQLTN